MTADAVLSADGIRKVVRDGASEHVILNGVSLTLRSGEQLALLGRSGSGKSTLLQILGGLDRQYEGTVLLHGKSLGSLSDNALAHMRRRKVGFVFQAYNLLGGLSVLENVQLPGFFGDNPIDTAHALAWLDKVGLADKASRAPATLSGGERQRVAIARAMVVQPDVILCDEPTGNLDEATGSDILNLFHLAKQEGAALVIATHDPSVADTADHVLRLAHGVLQ